MIQTAAIIWAVLATVLGIWASVEWVVWEYRAHRMVAKWADHTARTKEAKRLMGYWHVRATDAETALRSIKNRRHEAAKKARAAQLAQQAALVAAKAEQIRKEIGR